MMVLPVLDHPQASAMPPSRPGGSSDNDGLDFEAEGEEEEDDST
jgi:hypothetical protein